LQDFTKSSICTIIRGEFSKKSKKGKGKMRKENILHESDNREKNYYLPFFVYGTLKKGYGNHALLVAVGAKFMGNAVVENFAITGITIPFAFPSLGSSLYGELYCVKRENYDRALLLLDTLEGEGILYKRIEVVCKVGDKEYLAWMYAIPQMSSEESFEKYEDMLAKKGVNQWKEQF
jgi:gamma-glutamylcyclotransferase (GGCT)/AIG2-like uncharacterized protein YtfP